MNPVIKGEVIPPDVLATWHAHHKITTEPVKYGDDGKGGQYTATGDKHILINGVRWATIVMRGRGRHGPSYTIMDMAKKTLRRNSKEKNWKDREIIRSYDIQTHTPRRHEPDYGKKGVTARQRMLDMIPELVITGQLRDPVVIAAERQRNLEQVQAGQRAEEERRELIRDTLRSLAKRPDLTNSEREGLSLAYKDIFHGDMPE